MRYNKFLFIGLIFFLLQSCAFAPFSNNYSAKTIGKGNISLQGGAAVNAQIPFGRLGYGVGENVDVGLLAEEQWGETILGGWLKYGFINPREGFSLSGEASIGGSAGSSYFYVGPSIGYKLSWWEPYLTARYNYVSLDQDQNFDFLGTNINENTCSQYGLLTVGNTLWATDWLGLNANANVMFGDGFSDFYYNLGLVIEF